MSDDPFDDPVFRRFAAYALADMLPKLVDSKVAVSLAPHWHPGEPKNHGDVKYWVELGASIMLDKPIIVVAPPGQELPERLVRVADKVVRASMDDPDLMAHLADAIVAFSEEFGDAG